MKACKTYEQDLLLLAHGQLDASDAARVRKHLATCSPCDERLSQLTGVSLLLTDAVHFAPAAPVFSAAPHSAFLPAKQQWLLSAFLGGCILFALLSLMKTAESYAAPLPGMARIVPFASGSVPSDCLTATPCDAPSTVSAQSKNQRKAAKRHRVMPVSPASKF